MTSPAQRTLALLRSEGWTAHVVEHWNPHAHVRQDFGGFADIIAYAPSRGVLAVQCTSGAHVSERVDKLCALPNVAAWLRAGCRVHVWGWRKAGDRGKRKLWDVRVVALALNASGGVVDFELSARDLEFVSSRVLKI